jgi:hypothetical protein
MNDDELAFKIVRLYFEEIARLGFKRQLDLDQIINAYFYTLKKLDGKDVELQKAVKKIIAEEESKIGQDLNKVTTTTTTVESTQNAPVEKPKEKSITDILEESN